jgi:hypothetical protein
VSIILIKTEMSGQIKKKKLANIRVQENQFRSFQAVTANRPDSPNRNSKSNRTFTANA